MVLVLRAWSYGEQPRLGTFRVSISLKEKPEEAISEGALETPGLKRPWREAEAWHHVARVSEEGGRVH